METIFLEDDLAINAGEILIVLFEAGRFGRARGMGAHAVLRNALRSDYVRLASTLTGFTIQIAKASFFEGSHPWWVWIEKVN